MAGTAFTVAALTAALLLGGQQTTVPPGYIQGFPDYDSNAPVKITGRLVRMDTDGPNLIFHLIETRDGKTTPWTVISDKPMGAGGDRLPARQLEPGMEMIVRGYQSRDRLCDPACRAYAYDITIPDGRIVGVWSSGVAAPRDGADATEK